MPPRRIRDRRTGEVFTMPWESPNPPTPDDIATYQQQQEADKSSWLGHNGRLARALTAGKDFAMDEAARTASDISTSAGDLAEFGKGVGETALGMGKMMVSSPTQMAIDAGSQYASDLAMQPSDQSPDYVTPAWNQAKGMSPIPIDPVVDTFNALRYGLTGTGTPVAPHQAARSIGGLTAMAGLGAMMHGGESPVPDVTDPNAPPPPPVARAPRNTRMFPQAEIPVPKVDYVDPNIVSSGPDIAGQGRISVEGLQGEPAALGDIQPPETPYQPENPVGSQLVQGFQNARQAPPVEAPPEWATQHVGPMEGPVPDIANPEQWVPQNPPAMFGPEPAPFGPERPPAPVPDLVDPNAAPVQAPPSPVRRGRRAQQAPAAVVPPPEPAPVVAPAPVAAAPVVAPPVEAAPAPVAEVPAVVPKPTGKPTPDRVLRIARGNWDVVRTVFPDKLHADLFSAMGRMRKMTQGVKGIKPDFSSLARQLGVSEKEAVKIAVDYRAKVMDMAKALPKTAEAGSDTLEMVAPRLGETAAPVQSPPPVPNEPAILESQKALKPRLRKGKKLTDVPAATADVAAGADPLSQLQEVLKQKGAVPEPTQPPPAALASEAGGREQPVASSVKGVKVGTRVQAKVDELTSTYSGAEVENLMHDSGALAEHAADAGVKPGALKAALQRFISEDTGGVEHEKLKSGVQDLLSKLGGSEKGALKLPSKQQLGKGAGAVFDGANQLRMTSMLSGLALPKSLIGNLGAHFTAALEHRTIEPLKVLTQVKNIGRDLKRGWKGGQNPAQTGGVGRFNLPGRAMGAADYAAVESLKRAGISETDAREIMLTNANTLTNWKPLNTRLGKVLVPFRTIASNQFEQGLTRWKKYPAVYVGAVTLGAVAGSQIKDKEGLALASAFAGPYALPFLFGASLVQGSKALQGISPIPEWGITKTLTDPFGAIMDSPGRRWARSNLGFGAQAAREKRIEQGTAPSGGRGHSRGRSGR